MRRVHCAGCGMTEPLDTPNPRITTVTLTVGSEGRSWEKPNATTEDICERCVQQILARFFSVKEENVVSDWGITEPPILHAAVG